MRQIVLVIHNVRSAHNVGSLLRTADGIGIERVLISGYSPYPKQASDERLPHIAEKVNFQIHKTALGAEDSVNWQQIADIKPMLIQMKREGYVLTALEQTDKATAIEDYHPPDKIILVVGNELIGVEASLLELMDLCLEIPMRGQKESFNVAVAGAIAMHQLAIA